jgi:branched-chain amino acid transport system ATP-binding protein
MLAIGRALLGRPRLLMLDEPSLGLAPLVVSEMFRLIAGLRDRGISILLVEQNARAALRIADFGYVVDQGRVVGKGTATTLIGDPALVKSYFGMN